MILLPSHFFRIDAFEKLMLAKINEQKRLFALLGRSCETSLLVHIKCQLKHFGHLCTNERSEILEMQFAETCFCRVRA